MESVEGVAVGKKVGGKGGDNGRKECRLLEEGGKDKVKLVKKMSRAQQLEAQKLGGRPKIRAAPVP